MAHQDGARSGECLYNLRWHRIYLTPLCAVLLLTAATLSAQAAMPQADSSTVTPDGTAHVARVVPVPNTVSPQAQQSLARAWPDDGSPQSLAERRSGTDTWQAGAGKVFEAMYPVNVQSSTVAGVPLRLITPPDMPADNRNRILINLHGGGFNSDSGSLTETVPVAALSKIRVIAVLYRLAPEHPYPAALEDAIALYREVLKTHKPNDIAIFGISAGAILTGEVAVRIKQLGLPEPGALGIFSGFGD